ncbi:MAG: ABC transporter permease subunit [SAR324 cluster bacterium]|nr:ABC transporter permease subunit [SAR324 cluster bacterium]
MGASVFDKAKRTDKIARIIITWGGIFVIVCVIGILVLIAKVAIPLFLPPTADNIARFQLPEKTKALAVGMDEYLETGFVLSSDGHWRFFSLTDGNTLDEVTSQPALENATLISVAQHEGLKYTLVWSDGRTTLEEVSFRPVFSGSDRSIQHKLKTIKSFSAPEQPSPFVFIRYSEHSDEKVTTAVRLNEDGLLQVNQSVTRENMFGDEETEDANATLPTELPGKIIAATLDGQGKKLYAGTSNGYLLRWNLETIGEPRFVEKTLAFEDGRAITALGMIFGGNSLAVGDEKGGLTTWFPALVEGSSNIRKMQKIHDLESQESAIVSIVPSRRDKSLTVLEQNGTLHAHHMTSERHLLQLRGDTPLKIVNDSSRGNGLIGLDEKNQVYVWAVDNPHPDVSWKLLFQEIWYESYPEPAYVWQSSSASDDFEPKYSLIPLVFGSFKGTVYAMLFAIPLALLGAIYTSQFAQDSFRNVIKPAVEITAAMPSVIIGFLCALWLAPIIESYVVSVFLVMMVLPFVFAGFVGLWHRIRHLDFAKHVEQGYEFLMILPVLIVSVALALWLQPLVETAFFGGDFKLWLFQEMGLRYDQRNNIIISFGLGFMVIPIIFTIADDALSNVPYNLKAASLALGASRWQTVWRVVLPSASSGIFAAIIIGFGRAIGETMVVLMATGNTPIMDWSLFNGMRTLSANIAVEIPEAPADGTLYRILFLSAVLLFLITFVLNTLAELIRHRLRKRYGQM